MSDTLPVGFHRILAPHDFSPLSCRLLEKTLELGRLIGAEIEVFHAVHYPTLVEVEMTGEEPDIKSLESLLQTQVAAAVEGTERLGRKVAEPATKLVEGPAARSLVQRARELECDLIVMATHGRRGLTRFLIGSVTDEVIRSAPCPVLAVRRPAEWQGWSQLRRIVVPHDTSEHSQDSLRHALRIARACGASIDLIHVIPEPIRPSYYAAAAVSEYNVRREELKEATRKELERLLQAAGTDPSQGDVTLHTPAGEPAQEIVALAKQQDSGLIVIATHGLTGLDRLLIGSVTERVIRQADCPVLVIPPTGSDSGD